MSSPCFLRFLFARLGDPFRVILLLAGGLEPEAWDSGRPKAYAGTMGNLGLTLPDALSPAR